MIKSENGVTQIDGTASIICTDLCLIIKNINKLISEDLGNELAKELIMKSVELSFKSREEIKEEHKRNMDLLRMIIEGRL